MTDWAHVQNYKAMGPEGPLGRLRPEQRKGHQRAKRVAFRVHKGCGAPYEGRQDYATDTLFTANLKQSSGRCLKLFLAGIFILGRTNRNALGNQPCIGPDSGLNLVGPVRIGLEEGLGIVTALPDALAIIGIPGT